MKAFFIPKGGLLNTCIVMIIGVLCFGMVALERNIDIPAWLEKDEQVTPINFGNPESSGISFMVLVEDAETDNKYLPQLLQIFSKHHVEATFFVSGSWAEANGDILQSLLAQRHEIGNYAYSPVKPSDLDISENTESIQKAANVIKKQAGVETNLYTPPYGVLEADVLKASVNSGHKFILASIDSLDWQSEIPEAVISQVLKDAKSGSYVAIHPRQVTVQALPTILKELECQNLKFIKISDNLPK